MQLNGVAKIMKMKDNSKVVLRFANRKKLM